MKIRFENWKTNALSVSVAEHTLNTRVTLRAGHFGLSLLVNKEMASTRQLGVIVWLMLLNLSLLFQFLK